MKIKMASTRGAARAEKYRNQTRGHAKAKAAEKKDARRAQRRALKGGGRFSPRDGRDVAGVNIYPPRDSRDVI